MTNHSEYEPNSKVHSENLHPETIPTVETNSKSKRIGVVEEIPVRRETVTTTNSTSHSHPAKSKQDYGPSLPILAAIACCIPLAGILGYLIRQPGVRVVTRTVTQTVPVLTVPASPVVTQSPASPAPSAVSPSPVGPETVEPARVGPGRVGVDRVGNK